MDATVPRMAPEMSGAQRWCAVAGAAHVVVAEADAAVGDVVTEALERRGHRVTRAMTGLDALARHLSDPADLLVVGVELPGMGGLDVLRELRRTSAVPVLLVAETADVGERVTGLELGADDVVTKPYEACELTARVCSILRRSAPAAQGADGPGAVISHGGLHVDVRAREVHVGDRMVSLTTREFDLLAFLAASPREVFSREQLLRAVWGSTSDWQDPATVTEHVRRVRLKIDTDPAAPRWISTVRGAGYRFEGEGTTAG